jgi:hypothetical protein
VILPDSSIIYSIRIVGCTYNDWVFVADEGGCFLCSEGGVCDDSSYRWCVSNGIHVPDPYSNVPAGLVEEKVLVWFFNAFENYTVD